MTITPPAKTPRPSSPPGSPAPVAPEPGVPTAVPSALPSALGAVAPPRATRKLAIVLIALFVTLPPVLLLLPWRQNVPGSGRVSALHPLDRTQVIPAPVTGGNGDVPRRRERCIPWA